ncbi:MAG: RNA-directed DNA polymerase [Paludibacteraceae bacterium]|nr:RNA-directed DNA polymerase [Paludibacteraceae bacterium]
MYHLTHEQLLNDLHEAYRDAKRHKSSKPYVQHFEAQLDENLQVLADTLYNRTYKAQASTCFIITDPKKREVFAAHFRDRVVHHLYYNYTHELFERTFIQDAYSCIPGRGTHYGIGRLQQHIRQEGRNYSRPCYVLKMDIRGYFMHISRERLLEICLSSLRKMATHRVLKHVAVTWQDKIDMDFVEYLTREIVLLDPIENCHVVGDKSEWDDLPHEKSLFNSPVGCGLPIGNLTSQLYSNIYLNVLDQYMKRTLHCRHYGRYVDDFYVVSADREWLRSLVVPVRAFLHSELQLTLHDGKDAIYPIQYGVSFLGMFLKPWRMTVSRDSIRRMKGKRDAQYANFRTGRLPFLRIATALASFRGILSHGYNARVRKKFEV